MSEPSPEFNPADVSDLLGLMGDPGMVTAMREAVAKVDRARMLEGADRLARAQLILAGLVPVEEAGPDFFRTREGLVGMRRENGSVAEFPPHAI